MDARTEILRRVRAARVDGPPRVPTPLSAASSSGDLVAQLDSELRALTATLHRAASEEDVAAIVGELLTTTGARRLVAWPSPLIRQMQSAPSLAPHDLTWSFPTADDGGDQAWRQACIDADAGITEVDYALADTGTLVVRSSRDHPRLASLLPSLHVAIVRRAQLLPDLDALLTALPPTREGMSACLTLITGPSRTADIEKKIVLGVHGPETLRVVLVG